MAESKYKFVGDVKAGAIGDNTRGILIDKDMDDDSDVTCLVHELMKLHKSMKEEASNSKQYQCLSHIAEAEEEAKKGNKAKALKILQSGGKWAFDVSTKIGTNIISSYLKQELGL